MKTLLKITSILLIQMLIAGNYAIAGMDTLSPHINVQTDVLKSIYFSLCNTGSKAIVYSKEHVRSNLQLENEIKHGHVALITRRADGAHQVGLAKHADMPLTEQELYKCERAARILFWTLESKISRARSRQFLKLAVENEEHLRHYSIEDKEKLVFIAQNVPLLIRRARVTLHEGGSFGHARRGDFYLTGKLDNSAIWVGEHTLKDLPAKRLAIFLLEEAQHILWPQGAHQEGKVKTGPVHSKELFDELQVLAEECNEALPSTFCETDMMIGLGLGLSLNLQLVQTLEQRLEQRLEQKLVQRLELIQLLRIREGYYHLEEVLPGLWEKWKKKDKQKKAKPIIRKYQKHGFDFEYAAVKKDDYEDEYLKFLLGYGQGIPHYSESQERFYLIVSADFFPDEFIEYAAIHERGHELFDDHHTATILEFAVCKKEGKIKEYNTWLRNHNHQKFANVFTYIDDGIIPGEIKKSAQFSKHIKKLQELEEYGIAFDMIKSFKWPKSLKETFYIYEHQNNAAEKILENIFRKLGGEIQDWKFDQSSSFFNFVQELNLIIEGALYEIIEKKQAYTLNMERMHTAMTKYYRLYIGAKLHGKWIEYVNGMKAIHGTNQLSSEEIILIEKMPFVSLDFRFDKVNEFLKEAKEKAKADELPSMRVLLGREERLEKIEKEIIDAQGDYLRTGKIQRLEPLTQEDIANRTGIERGEVGRLLKGKEALMHENRWYPLPILIPSVRYKKYVAMDILKRIVKKYDVQLDSLKVKNSGGITRLLRETMRDDNHIVIKEDIAKKYLKEFLMKKLKGENLFPAIQKANQGLNLPSPVEMMMQSI